MTTDAQLINAARTDPDAFGELYRRHAGAVRVGAKYATEAIGTFFLVFTVGASVASASASLSLGRLNTVALSPPAMP